MNNKEKSEYNALVNGLQSKSSTRISSAAYIASQQLNNLEQKGEFEFIDGFGLMNDTILFNILPSIETILYQDEEYKNETLQEAGSILSEYENLDLIALLLFKEKGGSLYGAQEHKLKMNKNNIEEDLHAIQSKLENL